MAIPGLARALTFLSVDDVNRVQRLSKQAKVVAKGELDRIWARFLPAIHSESQECTDLLTTFYKRNLSQMSNPRKPLKGVTSVSFHKRIFLLHPSSERILTFRYIAPNELSSFQKALALSNNYIDKLNVVHSLMKKALAFPAHISCQLKLNGMAFLDRADFESYFQGRTFKCENEFYKVAHVGNLEKDSSITLLLQGLPIEAPSDQKGIEDTIPFLENLYSEIATAYNAMVPRMRELVSTLDTSAGNHRLTLLPVNYTPLEKLLLSTMLPNVLVALRCKPTNQRQITFGEYLDQEPAQKNSGTKLQFSAI